MKSTLRSLCLCVSFLSLQQDDQLSQRSDFASTRSYLFLLAYSKQNKTEIWQKYRTQKNGMHIFLRSIFLPLELGSLHPFNRFAEAADYFALAKHSLAIFWPG
jgi:hypothetical protein